MKKPFLLLILALLVGACTSVVQENIPLPEHPRPDFERAQWVNLNGYWDFGFQENRPDRRILVPFPWGSPLSEVKDEGDVAWYSRSITIPKAWKGKRIFLVSISMSKMLLTTLLMILSMYSLFTDVRYERVTSSGVK